MTDYIKLVSGEVFPHSSLAARAIVNRNALDFADRPYYLIQQSDLMTGTGLHQVSIPENAAAFTSGNLSERLQRYLQWREAWVGSGCAVVFNDIDFARTHRGESRMDQTVAGMATLVHEAGHDADCRSLVLEAKLRETVAGMATKPATSKATTQRPSQPARPIDHRVFIDFPHGPRFVRAVLHVWHRVNLGFPLKLERLFAAGGFYGMSALASYRLALGDEPERRLSEPISQILMTPAPRMFDQLWLHDFIAKAAA